MGKLHKIALTLRKNDCTRPNFSPVRIVNEWNIESGPEGFHFSEKRKLSLHYNALEQENAGEQEK